MSSTLVQSSIGSSVSTSTSAGCWNFSPSTKSPSPVPSSSSSPSSSPSPLSPEQEEEVSPLPPMSTTHHHQLNSNNNNNNSHRRDEHGFYSMESTTTRSDENNLVPKAELRDLLHSDNGSVLISVYYFIKNFIGGGQTAGSGVTIDTKIEEALDLVKSNLMFAVREEVDTLKEQIDVLMNKVHRLEFENRILRAHASSEALAMLDRAERRSLPNLSRSRSAGQSLSVFVNESNNNDYNADGSSVTD